MSKQDKPTEDFDAVAWTRVVRDELHRTYEDLSTEKFVRTLSEKGEQSTFGQKLAKKFKQVDPSTRSAVDS